MVAPRRYAGELIRSRTGGRFDLCAADFVDDTGEIRFGDERLGTETVEQLLPRNRIRTCR